MFNPSIDLTAIQNIFKNDSEILNLLSLTGASQVDILKKIIRESKWNDLVDSERRLCIYFVPSRKTNNESFNTGVLEIDCHVPAGEGFFAYEVLERVYKLLHKQKINNRYLYHDGLLGELSTADGFFCCGSRYIFNRKI